MSKEGQEIKDIVFDRMVEKIRMLEEIQKKVKGKLILGKNVRLNEYGEPEIIEK